VSERETRADLFTTLQSLAELVPEMRAGQLVAAVGELCADLHGRGLWDASDAEFLEAVWQFRRGYEAATAPPAKPPNPVLQPTGPATGASRGRKSRSRPGR
jgi:hypothetical protein